MLTALIGYAVFFGYGVNCTVDISSAKDHVPGAAKGLAAMCIITSLVYLADFIWGVIIFKKRADYAEEQAQILGRILA